MEQVRQDVDGYLVDFADPYKAKSSIEKACHMMHTFKPKPRHNDVIDLPTYIIDQEYRKVEPFYRIKWKKIAYFGISVFQYIIVICYYIVQFFYSRFVYSRIKKFE